MQRSLSRDTPRRNAHQAHSPINHRLKQTTFFRESCQGPMALMGRKVPPHARGIFLPSGVGGWEDRGSQPTPGTFPRSQPTPGTFPRLPWASPGRCTRRGEPASHLPSVPPVVQTSVTLCWAMGVTRAQLRRRGRRCWDVATKPSSLRVAEAERCQQAGRSFLGGLLLAEQAVLCVRLSSSDPAAASDATCLGGYLNIARACPLWCTPHTVTQPG